MSTASPAHGTRRRWRPRTRPVLALAVVALGLAAVAVPVALDHPGAPSSPLPVLTVQVPGAEAIRAEVAATEDARVRGLSGRSDVPSGTGMVLVFADPDQAALWMRQTTVALDVAWVSDDQVTATTTMQPCTPGVFAPCPVHSPPSGRATYAVEAPEGAFAHVQTGARVRTSAPVPRARPGDLAHP